MDLTKLKKETKLTDKEVVAAIGWVSEEVKKGRKTVELFSLVD